MIFHQKYWILFIYLFAPMLVSAQFARGDMYLTGNLSFSTSETEFTEPYKRNNRTSTLTIAPSFGFFLNESVAIGPSFKYAASWFSTSGPTINVETESNSFAAGIFATKYLELSDKFFFAISGDIKYGIESESQPLYDPVTGILNVSEVDYNALAVSVTPSFIFFPSNRWSVNASVGSLTYKYWNDPDYNTTKNDAAFDLGTVWLGVSYYLKRSGGE